MIRFSDVLNQDLDTTINYIHFNRVGDNELYTIGCELSEFDGENILNFIKDKLHDKIIISTCAVTESCKKACEDLVEMLHYLYQGRKEIIIIIITGCGVNYYGTFFEKYGKTLDNFNKFDVSFTLMIDIDDNLVEMIQSGKIDLTNIMLHKNSLFRFHVTDSTSKDNIIYLIRLIAKNKIYSIVNLVDDIRKSGRDDLLKYFSCS